MKIRKNWPGIDHWKTDKIACRKFVVCLDVTKLNIQVIDKRREYWIIPNSQVAKPLKQFCNGKWLVNKYTDIVNLHTHPPTEKEHGRYKSQPMNRKNQS